MLHSTFESSQNIMKSQAIPLTPQHARGAPASKFPVLKSSKRRVAQTVPQFPGETGPGTGQ